MGLRISVVTPSYNQGQYLEAAMQSVLSQMYPHLEYVVMDGGSTDHSPQIIRKHADHLHYWQSVPDDGHYAAVNAGFERTSGEVMAWLNADDLYTPWAFQIVAQVFERYPQVDWITTGYPLNWNTAGLPINAEKQLGYSYRNHMRGAYIPGDENTHALWNIQQESTFWRRSLWEQVGGLNPDYDLAADFDLWTRFFQHSPLYTVQTMLGGFRSHGAEQRSAAGRGEYIAQCKQILADHHGGALGWFGQRLNFDVGRRVPYPLNRWLGFAFEAKVIKYSITEDTWQIQTKYA